MLATLGPGLDGERLSTSARMVFGGVGRAMLDGMLPSQEPARQTAIAGLLERADGLVAGLPPHAQTELSQLLTLLASGVGRRTLAGLADNWDAASLSDIQAALQSMRLSRISLRQQAYQALHDIVGSAYFSDASTWSLLGYPGPLKI